MNLKASMSLVNVYIQPNTTEKVSLKYVFSQESYILNYKNQQYV